MDIILYYKESKVEHKAHGIKDCQNKTGSRHEKINTINTIHMTELINPRTQVGWEFIQFLVAIIFQ